MGWKNWPYWLKGVVIGFIVGIVLAVFFSLMFVDANDNNGFERIILYPLESLIEIFLFALWPAGIGAVFGWIIAIVIVILIVLLILRKKIK